MLTTTRFLGLDCVRLENAALSLLVTRSVGPRLLDLKLHGEESLFAELPDFTLTCPGAGRFHVWGGHRLWHAPELARRTYLPDDQPVEIAEVANGLLVTQAVEVGTGLQKSLRITLPGDDATVVIDHILANQGLWPVTCAPWAITQVRVGGVAILPQVQGHVDADGLLPNRQVALWPYTDAGSPHLTWGNRFLLVHAGLQEGALKVGFPNPRGWLAYHRAGTLFVKKARFDPTMAYYDFGSSSECYCNSRFLELETLGGATTIQPGGEIVHREVWELYGNLPLAEDEASIQEMVDRLQLEQDSA